MVMFRLSILFIMLLAVLAGCRASPPVWSIYSFERIHPTGKLSVTILGRVTDPSMCAPTAAGARKGVSAGNPQGNFAAGRAQCLTELPVELQKVVNGERLPGAYIVKSSVSNVLVYTVSRGFPLDIPNQVCQDLIESNRRNAKVKDVDQTCLPPAEAL